MPNREYSLAETIRAIRAATLTLNDKQEMLEYIRYKADYALDLLDSSLPDIQS